MKEEYKGLAVAFLYGQIKGLADQLIGNMAIGIDTDIILAALGYYKRNTWWGKALLYSAVTSIGLKGGISLGGLLGGGHKKASTQAVPPAYARLMARYAGVR